MFYEHFVALCAKKGVSPSRATEEAGINKSAVTYWKKNPNSKPTGQVAIKLCNYFGITMADLYGEDKEKPTGKSVGISDEDIKFALSGGEGVITDEQFEEVKKFVQFIKERDKLDQK